eukprot:366221-Chlamydomonas_euryale.AAC.1
MHEGSRVFTLVRNRGVETTGGGLSCLPSIMHAWASCASFPPHWSFRPMQTPLTSALASGLLPQLPQRAQHPLAPGWRPCPRPP